MPADEASIHSTDGAGPDNQGILFVAVGGKYIRSAMRAARTVRKFCPGLPVHLFGFWQEDEFGLERSPDPFTSVARIENPHTRSKVDYLSRSPYGHTLYLDSDTALNADIRGMFRLLERFDIAMCHIHRRNAPTRNRIWRIDMPRAFPQFNSGVLLYRRTPAVLRLFENWAAAFWEAGAHDDQLTLRELLWLSDLRIATLPPEYNVRFMKYHYLWTKSEAITKIFHLRRFHEGPFWFLKAWVRQAGRALLRRGIDPRRWIGMKK